MAAAESCSGPGPRAEVLAGWGPFVAGSAEVLRVGALVLAAAEAAGWAGHGGGVGGGLTAAGLASAAGELAGRLRGLGATELASLVETKAAPPPPLTADQAGTGDGDSPPVAEEPPEPAPDCRVCALTWAPLEGEASVALGEARLIASCANLFVHLVRGDVAALEPPVFAF